ncbi:hypothetical protein BH10PAT4_BH10PAT4_0730 [soil metagenome]
MPHSEPSSQYEPVNTSNLSCSEILQIAALNSDIDVLNNLQIELSKRLSGDPYDQEVRSNHTYVTQKLRDLSLVPRDTAFEDIVKGFHTDN